MAVPKIRFPGFTEDWEQRKLGDIVERITRKNTNNESDLPLTISAQYGLIDQNEFFDKRIASKDVSGYYLVKNGEFAYNKSTSNDAPWGPVKRLDRYKNGVVSTLYIVFSIRDSNTTDSDFLATYYDTDRWHSGIQAVAAEGARNHGLLNISASDFFNTTLKMPADIEEQRKIGAFFKEIDNTITLHQRKLESMKLLKKSLLQKMFPKSGETVPEVRFPGFTDAWEQRKLDKIANRYDNLRIPVTASDRISGTTPYYGANGIQDYVKGFTHDGEFVLIAEDGANDLHNYPVQYVNGKVWVNNHAHVLQGINGLVDTRFLGYAFSQVNMEAILVGGSRAKLNASDLMKIEIRLPRLMQEQQHIATFLHSLDQTITLHQRKVEALQKLKKSLLQQMFV